MSIRIIWFLMLFVLAGCARPASTVTATGAHPASAGGPRALPLHSLAVFGTFDASTTVPEVIQRAGSPDFEATIQPGGHLMCYSLLDQGGITIHTDGGSQILWVQRSELVDSNNVRWTTLFKRE